MGGKARLIELPIGHFDVYLGEWFERSCGEQVEFFKEALRPLSSPAIEEIPNDPITLS